MNLQQENTKKTFRHPIRSRILGILRDGKPRTQQELGKILSMSNAAIHYHVKLLAEIDVIRLHNTRPGPKGIIEKLYTANIESWPDVPQEDVNYYLDYTVSWMNERHREGVNLLKAGDNEMPFLAGSFSFCAPLEELIQFKRDVEKLFNDFYLKHSETEKDDLTSFSATFSVLPSKEENVENSQNILEFEP